MTYDIGIFIALIFGLILGHFIFGIIRIRTRTQINSLTTETTPLINTSPQDHSLSTSCCPTEKKTIGNKMNSSFLTLPVELVYRILDNFERLDIFLSIQNVCTRFNIIISTYTQYGTFTELKLGSQLLNHKKIQLLAHALQSNTAITLLNLECSYILADGVQYLAQMLQNNSTLTMLNLERNQICAKEPQYLAQALEIQTLITFDLRKNQIDSIGAQYLAHALQRNTTLITLDLRSNGIGTEGAQYLAYAFPNFRITW
ncbi:unnamed protein product [Adineta steineri]|uniref:F-box domain-containing protein n=1 Tax=Adineta steineri TaxID=433720 RepID=A0A814PW81_9BILA|nr:unnamed protein product [Adineta steineri]CAF1111403.1 unnamed protein product [Adineta steineri]